MINPEVANQLYNYTMVEEEPRETEGPQGDGVDNYRRITDDCIADFSTGAIDQAETMAYIQEGNELIKNGKVAVVLLATESAKSFEGSNDAPSSKGLSDLNLPSNKLVFQILMERFLRVQ